MSPMWISRPVFLLAFATASVATPPPSDPFGPVLKRRVAVEAAGIPQDEREFSARISAPTAAERLRVNLQREIMTGTDVLKAAIGASAEFRVIEPAPGATPGKDTDLLLNLAVAWEDGAKPWRVTLRVIEPASRIARGVYAAEATNLNEAVQAAVRRMGRELALGAIVLEVIQTASGGGVVSRGLDDGLRVGARLAGFRPAADTAKDGDREVALITGTPLGEYEVVSARAGVSVWRPLGSAPPLATGDLLEVPEFRLRRPDEPTRARDIQDTIYKK